MHLFVKTVPELQSIIEEEFRQVFTDGEFSAFNWNDVKDEVNTLIHFHLVTEGLAYLDPQSFSVYVQPKYHLFYDEYMWGKTTEKPLDESSFVTNLKSSSIARRLMNCLQQHGEYFTPKGLIRSTLRLTKVFEQYNIGVDDINGYIQRMDSIESLDNLVTHSSNTVYRGELNY